VTGTTEHAPTRVEAEAVPALDLVGVRAGYGPLEVLHGIDLSLGAGRVLALLGPNGAGKSTTLRVASGRLHPKSGRVLCRGQDVTKASPQRLTRLGICAIPEGRGVFPNLTVAENVRMWTFGARLRWSEAEEIAYQRFPVLAERRRQQAGTLSGGEQQMLAMSRALCVKPTILLLDEISMGLAPLAVATLYEVVAALADEGIAIIVVEQFAQTALHVADEAVVLSQGRIELRGRPDEVGEALAGVYLRHNASPTD
jgi:branched-chain amino acid transport system ATP-binding protein